MCLATCSICRVPETNGGDAAQRAPELKPHGERGPLVTAQAERGKAGQGRNPTSWGWNEKVSAIEFPRTGLSAPAKVHIGRDELRGTQEACSY